jgi:topoisomerase IV subunit A
VLSRGKGSKLMNIPAARARSQEELIMDVQVLTADDELTIHAGKRHFTLKPADLARYQGERARRGNCLPRGLQNVTALQVTKK